MAVSNTLDTLNGLFKNVYADQLQDLIPDGVKLLVKIPFSKRDSIGQAYNQPVVLGMEHGVTFAGPNEDAFNLQDAVAGQIKNAEVKSSQLVLKSLLGYASASRSAEGGAKAFKSATKFLVGNMLRSVTKKLEIEMLYGQVGYATLAAAASSTTIQIPAAEWAPGIWAGAENMPIDIRDSAGGTSRLRTVTAVNFELKQITVDSAVVLALGDVIYHKGAYGKEFAGIHKIITNTGSLFGIDASQYSLWKGNTYDASAAPLSFQKLQEAVAKAVEKGLDSDVTVIVNPEVWADLLTDQAALRMYDSSYSPSKMENGAKELKFHGQNGMIEIVPSIYCKRGVAYVLSMDEWMRIGSTEVTFRRPGRGDEFFRDVEGAAAYELRCYTDQCVFSHAPGKNVLIQNIA
jgi:hypothetical protein